MTYFYLQSLSMETKVDDELIISVYLLWKERGFERQNCHTFSI